MAKIKKIDDELKLASEGVKTATDNYNNMSYDTFKQGSMYDGLKKSYEQQGQQAMKDTIGQVVARTGGMASSYATTAAQQSYNNSMSQLEDIARAMYNDEYSKARDKVTLAQGENDRAHQRDLETKALKDAELKMLLGSEDFNWDTHDWDADGMIGEADTDGEGTPADYFSGSTYGEDYWKTYAQGTANDRKNARIADEKKNGTLFNSLVKSAGNVLDEAGQESFDEVYGDGAYETVRKVFRMMESIQLQRGEEAKVDELYDILSSIPNISRDQVYAILEYANPEMFKAWADDEYWLQ